MDKQVFDKLCDDTFAQFSSTVRKTIKDFPDTIDVDKGNVLSDDNLKKLMEKPIPLYVNEDSELYYVDDEGENVIIDPRIEDSSIFKGFVDDVFTMLPTVPFDLQCGGIKRKQKEVASAYIVCVINSFLSNIYINDIKDVVSNYDFSLLKSKNIGGGTFSDVLKT